MQKISFLNYLLAHQWLIALIILWTLPWKGVALWRAARNRSIAWFVVIFLLNTLGVLEIIYIFFFSRKTPPAIIEAEDKSKIEKKIV